MSLLLSHRPTNVKVLDKILEDIGVKARVAEALIADRYARNKFDELVCWWEVKEGQIKVIAQFLDYQLSKDRLNCTDGPFKAEAEFAVKRGTPFGPVGTEPLSWEILELLRKNVREVQVVR